MQRPTLNPTVFDDPDRQPLAPMPREPWHAGRLVAQLARAIGQMLRAVWKLLWTPLIPRRMLRTTEQRSVLGRVVAPLIFRLMFVAVMLLVAVALNVHLLTHPFSPAVVGPPVTGAVHVEPVTLRASDGVAIEAFLAPAIDEKQLLRHGEVAIRAKWPAVVLVPDQRSDGRELDKLIRTLHDSGYVALLVRLRGTGTLECAQTLGLHERLDVAAAVGHLRGLKYVDQARVSIIATGTGATAAMLARREDATIQHVIAYDPVVNFDQAMGDSVAAGYLRPACRWAFEVMHRVDVEDLNRDSLLHELQGHVLLLASHPSRPPQRQMITSYLQRGAQQISTAR